MSDIQPRVRISFTVGIDEVPDRIARLMEEAKENLEKLVVPLETQANALYKDKNAVAAQEFVRNIRLKLMDVDLRLEDCQSLLTNYQGALLEIETNKQRDDETPPDPEPPDPG